MKIVKGLLMIFIIFSLQVQVSQNIAEVVNLPRADLLQVEELADSGLDYNESTRIIQNSDCGFYKAVSYKLTKNNTEALWNKEFFANAIKTESFLHIRLGLEDFSTNAGGKDSEISQNVLTCLQQTFNELRLAGATAIIRFSYNVEGVRRGGKYADNEPGIELIKKHIISLGTVISVNQDVILGVETGMLGPWGEQHSTIMGNPQNINSYYQIIEAWLDSLPDDMFISNRRPLYFRHWANIKLNLGLTADNVGELDVNELDVSEHDRNDLKRIGCYNDGYLGSDTDWGTYDNREQELKWLNGQTRTMFGGEVIVDDITNGMGEFNNIGFLEQEAFITRTSYLNIDWNYEKVISNWQKNTYTGNDKLYKDANVSEYYFVKNRLGHRLYLANSQLSKTIDLEKSAVLKLSGEIANAGFSNVATKKKVQIILNNEKARSVFSTDYNINGIMGAEHGNYDISVNVPKTLPIGKYAVYMRISSVHEKGLSGVRALQFANKQEQYNSEIGGNLLGYIEVVKSDKTDSSESGTQSENGCNKADATMIFAALGLMLFIGIKKV